MSAYLRGDLEIYKQLQARVRSFQLVCRPQFASTETSGGTSTKPSGMRFLTATAILPFLTTKRYAVASRFNLMPRRCSAPEWRHWLWISDRRLLPRCLPAASSSWALPLCMAAASVSRRTRSPAVISFCNCRSRGLALLSPCLCTLDASHRPHTANIAEDSCSLLGYGRTATDAASTQAILSSTGFDLDDYMA
jgi:hypothetical protein